MKKNIFDKIDDAKANRAALLKELKNQKAESEKEKARKETEAAEILEKGNADEYAAAKAASRNAADKIEFYTKRIEDIKAAPIIDKSDRAYYINELDKYKEKKAAEDLAIIADDLQKAYNAAEDYRAALNITGEYYKAITEKEYRPGTFEDVQAANGLSNAIERALSFPIIQGNK